MPVRPPRTCCHPGCLQFASGSGLCGLHHAEREVRQAAARARHLAKSDIERGSAAARGYDHRWRAYRKSFLVKHPLCRACEAEDRVTAAVIIDHIVPHRGDSTTFWDKANHQPLCEPCHTKKTLGEMRARRQGAAQ